MLSKLKTCFTPLLLCMGLLACRPAPQPTGAPSFSEPTAIPSTAQSATEQPTSTTGTVIHAQPVLNCTTGTELPTYTVQAGDTLFNIAMRAEMTLSELQEANCIPNSDESIFVGQNLYVRNIPEPQVTLRTALPSETLPPVITVVSTMFTLPPPTATNIPATNTPVVTHQATATSAAPTIVSCILRLDWPVYIVQAGDTLYGIATRAGMTVAELQDANCMPRSSTVINVGQRLYVRSIPAQLNETLPPVITQPANTVVTPTQPPTSIPPTPTPVVTHTPAAGNP